MNGDEFWKRHARRYDSAIGFFNSRIDQMTALVTEDVGEARTVLEVAAGTGLVTERLAAVCPELTATDASPEMLSILRGRLEARGYPGVRVAVADVMALDFPAASFDAVVAANLLHLVPDPGAALGEMRRVLRPDGRLSVPTFGHGETVRAQLASRLLRLAGFPVVSRFRHATLRQMVEGAGFVVEREAVLPGILPVLHLTARPVAPAGAA